MNTHFRKTFWQDLRENARLHRRVFFTVAPMADVTDAPFRSLIAKYSRKKESGGGPDVFWTEFVSANGLCSSGREVLLYDLQYTEDERPIVAQLFTADPENMYKAVKLVIDLGFDGVDINMGCPDRTIEKQGAGASMIKNLENALLVIQSARQAIDESGKNVALSVKTRLGYSADDISGWIEPLLRSPIDALTIHARTRKELSKFPARWEKLSEIVRLRDTINPHIVIIGNGDVFDIPDGIQKAHQSGVDGVMVGRALFGNPWFFDSAIGLSQKGSYDISFIKNILLRVLPNFLTKKLKSTWLGDERYSIATISEREKLTVLKEHILLFDSILGTVKHFAVMKKHFKAYTAGMKNAKELRMRLMDAKTKDEAISVIEEYL